MLLLLLLRDRQTDKHQIDARILRPSLSSSTAYDMIATHRDEGDTSRNVFFIWRYTLRKFPSILITFVYFGMMKIDRNDGFLRLNKVAKTFLYVVGYLGP